MSKSAAYDSYLTVGPIAGNPPGLGLGSVGIDFGAPCRSYKFARTAEVHSNDCMHSFRDHLDTCVSALDAIPQQAGVALTE